MTFSALLTVLFACVSLPFVGNAFSFLLFFIIQKFTIRREFLQDVRALRARLVLVGLAHVVLLPFLLLFMVVYFFLQNAQEWHSSKASSVSCVSA